MTNPPKSANFICSHLEPASTSLIGIVMSATSNPFFGLVFSAMEDAARQHGFTVLLSDSHDDVVPLLQLIDEGIHYVHMEFEQLQALHGARDLFGVPLLAEDTVRDALWASLELKPI